MVAEPDGVMFPNTFTVTRLENGKFSLKSYYGKYLIAKEDGSLNANSRSVVTEGMFLIKSIGSTI